MTGINENSIPEEAEINELRKYVIKNPENEEYFKELIFKLKLKDKNKNKKIEWNKPLNEIKDHKSYFETKLEEHLDFKEG